MYLSDSTLHSAIDGISRTLGIYVEVEGAEYAPASIIRLEWENECIDGSNFTIGGTLSNRIELEIYHDESILVGDQIKPSVEIEVEGEMIRIPLGIFYVDSVSVNKEITTLTAYDAMISLDKEYIPSANHTSLRALASDVCQQAGILMKSEIDDIPIARSLEGYSYRETLGFIASFHAGNMVLDRDGQFKIKTYEVVDRTIPNHAYFSFDQKDTYRVSAVMCNFGSIGIGRGDDTAQCVTFENPYVTEEHIDRIYLKLKDLTFVAGKLNYRGDMNLDAGDLFTLTDANGQDHLLLCGQNQLTFTGGLTGTLNSIGEGQGANQYVEYKFKNKKSITQLTVEMGKIQAEVSEVEKKLENDYSTTSEMNSAIQLKADSITSTVNANYTTLNDKFNNYPTTTQMNSAITQKANEITSTVAETYTTKSEANGTYATKSELSQTTTDFTFKLQNSGGYNVIRNGDARSGQDHWWSYWLPSATWEVRNDEWTGYKNAFQIYNANSVDGLENCIYQNIETQIGKTYTLSMLVAGHRGRNYGVVVNGSGTTWIASTDSVEYGYGGVDVSGWKRVSCTFVATENSMQIRLVSVALEASAHGWFREIQVEEGYVPTHYSPHPEEIYSGVTKIDNTGITVTHSADSSYSHMGANGFKYYDAHANWSYHSLMKQGWLGDISGTSWSRTITLPPSFRNKVFSVIVSVEMVNAVNTHDVIKHYKVTVPHNTVNYANGTFVINMSALAYYVPGQGSATAITTNVSWIAIA